VEILAGRRRGGCSKAILTCGRLPGDFAREWLSLKCAVKVVKDIDEALKHIDQYSTKHSEAIVSRNKRQCERFLAEVDAAAFIRMLQPGLLTVSN